MMLSGMESYNKMMHKITLITGATAGIGLACAQRFSKEGHDLIITGRRKERLNGKSRSGKHA